jgi:hypothetical protein
MIKIMYVPECVFLNSLRFSNCVFVSCIGECSKRLLCSKNLSLAYVSLTFFFICQVCACLPINDTFEGGRREPDFQFFRDFSVISP